MKRLDKIVFKEQVSSLKQAVSVQGKVYRSIEVVNGQVKFVRGGKTKAESIDFEELYQLYREVPNPTNSEARAYISGRVQSPAVSIINSLGKTINPSLKEAEPIKVPENAKTSRSEFKQSKERAGNPEKDETKFFDALSELLGRSYLLSKSIGKPINSSDAFLSDNYRDYHFSEVVENSFDDLLSALKSNKSFSSNSLSHFIDGLVVDHPMLGSRIIEFDEEQHFTPALKDALQIQSDTIKLDFSSQYLESLNDVEYLNDQVLRKHRIKHRFEKYPASFMDLVDQLEGAKISGYIKPKEHGFPYVGGRIAQRAYYDCLRNAAHLSPKNKGFNPPLRLSKKYFEDKAGKHFKEISGQKIKKLITEYLRDAYNIELKMPLG